MKTTLFKEGDVVVYSKSAGPYGLRHGDRGSVIGAYTTASGKPYSLVQFFDINEPLNLWNDHLELDERQEINYTDDDCM